MYILRSVRANVAVRRPWTLASAGGYFTQVEFAMFFTRLGAVGGSPSQPPGLDSGLDRGMAEAGWVRKAGDGLEAGRGAGHAMRLGLSQRATHPALRATAPGPSPAAREGHTGDLRCVNSAPAQAGGQSAAAEQSP